MSIRDPHSRNGLLAAMTASLAPRHPPPPRPPAPTAAWNYRPGSAQRLHNLFPPALGDEHCVHGCLIGLLEVGLLIA
jgi:hypothetical protein